MVADVAVIASLADFHDTSIRQAMDWLALFARLSIGGAALDMWRYRHSRALSRDVVERVGKINCAAQALLPL